MSQLLSSSLRVAVLTTAILASAPASAGIIVNGTDAAHQEEAKNPLYESTGFVRGLDADGNGFIAGTFQLIHPSWGVTVKHVIDGYTTAQVGFELDARDPNRVLHAVDSWVMHPDADLALLHFADPILGVAPAEIYWGALTPGTHFNWAGYGRLAYPNTGDISPTGTKRAGENLIDQISPPVAGISEPYVLYDFEPLTGGQWLPLEMGATPGDSGSGLRAQWDGRMQLFALNAIGYGFYSGTAALRLGPHEDFIKTYVPIGSVPEPSSVLLLLATLPAFLARNGRHRKTY